MLHLIISKMMQIGKKQLMMMGTTSQFMPSSHHARRTLLKALLPGLHSGVGATGFPKMTARPFLQPYPTDWHFFIQLLEKIATQYNLDRSWTKISRYFQEIF